ncbi:MAG: ferrous iron transport protein A [Actinomycetia bacterium]|nr:ferrous iron transport protein A [Actinomycetes bacterium]MCP4083707.1 ferrous iron transport protein A [Actinomycetes bacterium]
MMAGRRGEVEAAADSDRVAALADIPPRVKARIVAISAGKDITRRCLALGLRVGAEVTVSHRRGRGVVVASDGNRVALGGDMAELVMVEIVS